MAPRTDYRRETWTLVGALLVIWAGLTLCGLTLVGCSEDGSNRSYPPVLYVENDAQRFACVAQIASWEALKGPADLSAWAVHVTGDPVVWDSWIAPRGLPPATSGYVDHANRWILCWAHNGAGDQDVVEVLPHEIEHITAPTRPHPFTDVDDQARACSQWIVAERAAGRAP